MIASPVIEPRQKRVPTATAAERDDADVRRSADVSTDGRLGHRYCLQRAKCCSIFKPSRVNPTPIRPITRIEANTPRSVEILRGAHDELAEAGRGQEELRRDHADQCAADRLAHAGHRVRQGVGHHHLAPQRPFAGAERVRHLDQLGLDAARAFDRVVEHRETPRTETPPAPWARSRSPSSTG